LTNTHKIKKAGFDSFYDYETNALSKATPSGIGVFDPAQIKSAVGNNGQYDLNEPEINKAEGGYIHDPERDIRHALLLSQMMKSGATLPAAVDLARQLKPGRR